MTPDLIGSVYPSLEELRESFICKNNKKLIKKPVYDIDVNVQKVKFQAK